MSVKFSQKDLETIKKIQALMRREQKIQDAKVRAREKAKKAKEKKK